MPFFFENLVMYLALTILLCLPLLWMPNELGFTGLYNNLLGVASLGLLGCWWTLQNQVSLSLAGLKPISLLFGLLSVALVIQWVTGHSISYLGITGYALFCIAAAWFAAALGANVASAHHAVEPDQSLLNAEKLLWAFVAVTAIQVAFGWLQYVELNIYLPFIAPLDTAGRIFGNIRQPNHFALLLCLGLAAIACVFAQSQMRLNKARKIALCMLYVFCVGAIVLTTSRTGLALVALLTLLGCLKSAQHRITVWLVRGTLPLYFVWRQIFLMLDKFDVLPFWGAVREFSASSEANADRIAFWTSSWQLTQENIWFGVGFGKLSKAAFESGYSFGLDRHIESSHNLVLDLAVQFGVPTALAFLLALAYCLWQCRGLLYDFKGRMLLFGLLAPLLHHQFEYPLEYTYILFPWSFMLGYAVVLANNRRVVQKTKGASSSSIQREVKPAQLASIAVLLMSVWIAWDFQKIKTVYHSNAGNLARDLQLAYGSSFFTFAADYSVLLGIVIEPNNAAQAAKLAKKVTQFRFDERVVYQYTNAAILSGNVCVAHALVERAKKADARAYEKLRLRWEQSKWQPIKEFIKYKSDDKLIRWGSTGPVCRAI